MQLVENTLLNCFLWLTVQSTETVHFLPSMYFIVLQILSIISTVLNLSCHSDTTSLVNLSSYGFVEL